MRRVPPTLGPGARAACALASLAACGGIAASLLGLLNAASPAHWLQPSPELLQMAALCQDLPARAERMQCTQRVVAARLRHETRATLLAAGPRPAGR